MAETRCKYYKQKKQVSYDGGQTWQDVIPYEYQKGALYEQRSQDCGYVPPVTQYRWVRTNDTTCIGSPEPPEPEYDKQPFTVIPREDDSNVYLASATSVYYTSTDSGNTWVEGGVSHVAASTKVMLKGNLTAKSGTTVGIGGLIVTKYSGSSVVRAYYDVEGNITSLTNWVLRPYSFRSFFNDYNSYQETFKQKIVSAKNLYLPGAIADFCYASMFAGSKYLTEAPVIRGSFRYHSCHQMFYDCDSITSVKIIGGYMYKHCAERMFMGCGSLNYVECVIDWREDVYNTTSQWLLYVPSKGTFVTKASTIWDSGGSGIPGGWTRVNVDE